MRDATGDTRHCRISCAAGSGQRATGSMREALYAATSAHHGTDAIHKVHHTTGAAACSYTHESARGKANEVRRLAHLGALSGSLAALDLGRRPHSSLSAKVESSFDKLFAPTAESRFTLLRFGDFLTFR